MVVIIFKVFSPFIVNTPTKSAFEGLGFSFTGLSSDFKCKELQAMMWP
jgi:hypothetical protein